MSNEDGERLANTQMRVGTVLLGKYLIERVLGMGGMAVVYGATHRNRQPFAIKMLHREMSVDSEIRNRFLREGYVANSVQHRGAVKVLDDDVAEDGSAFLVMELLDGDTVETTWTKHGRRLPPQIVLAIAHQLLDVLATAHARSIVHRDIKPANLFLTREGVVKVLDFGIARLREATSSHATQTGALLGTPAFMAPEQALGRSKEIDGQTDLWAVGATMFSLLTGELVHEGDNPQVLMVQAATRPARSLATVMPEASLAVVALVDRALAFEKGQRWASAESMRDAVREVLVAEYGANASEAPLLALFEPVGEARMVTLSADSWPPIATPGPGLGARSSSGPKTPGALRAPTPVIQPPSFAGASRSLPPAIAPSQRPRRWVWVAVVGLGAPVLVGVAAAAMHFARGSVTSSQGSSPATDAQSAREAIRGTEAAGPSTSAVASASSPSTLSTASTPTSVAGQPPPGHDGGPHAWPTAAPHPAPTPTTTSKTNPLDMGFQ